MCVNADMCISVCVCACVCGLTEQAGHAGVRPVAGLQVHLVGVQPGRGDGQVPAQPVDVLDQGHVHLQAPLAAGLLGVAGVYTRAPRG